MREPEAEPLRMKLHLATGLALVLAIVTAQYAGPSPSWAMTTGVAPPNVDSLLRGMASEPSDDCSVPPPSASSSADVDAREIQLFEAVRALVADRLNASPRPRAQTSRSRAVSALHEVEQSSAENNKGWPAEDRFHFKVLDLPPAILVRMTYRCQSVFVLFGSYYLNRYAALDPGTKWREADFVDPSSPPSEIELFPLHRGPGGRARVLAKGLARRLRGFDR